MDLPRSLNSCGTTLWKADEVLRSKKPRNFPITSVFLAADTLN